MRVMLDTCTWIWYVADESRLSREARKAVGDDPGPDSLVVSVLSCWEVYPSPVKTHCLSYGSAWEGEAPAEPGVRREPHPPVGTFIPRKGGFSTVTSIAKLVEKGKLQFTIPVRDWMEAACRQPGIVLHELTPGICLDSTQPPGQFHGDPADQIIVATARHLGLPLVTSDKRIRSYQEVTTIW